MKSISYTKAIFPLRYLPKVCYLQTLLQAIQNPKTMARFFNTLALGIFDLIVAVLPLSYFGGALTLLGISCYFQSKIFSALFLPEDFYYVISLVIILEMSKGALIFFNKIYSHTKLPFKTAHLGTVIISGFCMLLMLFSNLYNPNEKEVQNMMIVEIKALHETEVSEINAAFDKEVANATGQLRTQLLNQTALREIEKNNVVRGQIVGPRYIAYQKEIERLENKIYQDTREIENRRQQVLAELKTKLDDKIEVAKKDAKNLLKSGHPLLLKVLYVVNIGQEFSPYQYIIIVLLLSVFITVCIESIILLGFSLLAEISGKSNKAVLEGQNLAEIAKIFVEAIENVRTHLDKASKDTMEWFHNGMVRGLNKMNKIFFNNYKINKNEDDDEEK